MTAVFASIEGNPGSTVVHSGRWRNQPRSVNAPIVADSAAQIHGKRRMNRAMRRGQGGLAASVEPSTVTCLCCDMTGRLAR